MERRDELLKVFEKTNATPIVINLIDQMIHLESKLDEYLVVLNEPITAENKNKYKFYHSLYTKDLQQYTNIVGKLSRAIGDKENKNDSPLRAYFKKRAAKKE